MSDHSNISKLDATPGMALLDCVPVLFFWAMISLIGSLWSFPLYWVGAVLMGLAGTAKALWKVVKAFSGKDIPVLSKYFGPVMGTGFCSYCSPSFWTIALGRFTSYGKL